MQLKLKVPVNYCSYFLFFNISSTTQVSLFGQEVRWSHINYKLNQKLSLNKILLSFVSVLFTLMSNCATLVSLVGLVVSQESVGKQGLRLHSGVETRGDPAWFWNKCFIAEWKKALAMNMRRPYLYELCHLSTCIAILCSQAPKADTILKQPSVY